MKVRITGKLERAIVAAAEMSECPPRRFARELIAFSLGMSDFQVSPVVRRWILWSLTVRAEFRDVGAEEAANGEDSA